MFDNACKPHTWLESRVYMLLRYHGMELPEQIDLKKLCSCYRIELQTICGRSRTHTHPMKENHYVIAVDQSLDPLSMRVKIAHEFGHLVLHEGVQPKSSDLMIDWQEAQANHFAEHLLMPFFMFAPLISKLTLYNAPQYLSSVFLVPEALAKKRFDRFLNRLYLSGYTHLLEGGSGCQS
ncbi:ImmA/IrrE family metallo-endopeptidase [Brevibacillus sp. H7]|uniref:ImmA/IrrE family metallo-endopeptidase n=1 Tax=Brevibacillus sp. H7 TaxID=3349138 RepID=UPI00381A5E22